MSDRPTRPGGMPARDRIPSEDTYLIEEADAYMDALEQRNRELVERANNQIDQRDIRITELEAERAEVLPVLREWVADSDKSAQEAVALAVKTCALIATLDDTKEDE